MSETATEESSPLLKRGPFTPYDIMGYLVPGGVLLVVLGGFEGTVRQLAGEKVRIHTPVYSALSRVVTEAAHNGSWSNQALTILVAITTAYVIGHIVASVSALAVDRWYVEKAHGYPFRFLLRLDSTEGSDVSRAFHRGFFFWLNVYLFLRFFSLPNGLPLSDFIPRPFRELVPGALSVTNLAWAARVCGWLLIGMLGAKIILSATAGSEDRTTKRLLETTAGKVIRRFLAFLIRGLARPARVITHFLGNYLHSRNRLDEASIRLFKSGLLRMLNVESSSPDAQELLQSSSTYWYASLHIRATSTQLFEPVDNWLRLYGFARNLATAFYLAFLYCALWWLNQGSLVDPGSQTEKRYIILLLPLLYWSASFLLLLRYYYLYVGYYTKYILRTYVYLTAPRS
jgi:hypothetical protein